MTTIKGQNLRIKVNDGLAIAAATSCTVHLQIEVGESSTKDSEGDWQENEVTGMSWDAQTDCLVIPNSDEDETAAYLEDLYDMMEAKTPVAVSFEQTYGTKNRQNGGAVLQGEAIITDIAVTAQNRQNVTASIKLQGTGELDMPAFLVRSFALPITVKNFSNDYIVTSEVMTAAELLSALEVIDSNDNTLTFTNSNGTLVAPSGFFTLTKDSNDSKKWNVGNVTPSTTILSVFRLSND